MPNNNELERFPVRRSPRLKGFDYSSKNYYFVTICTKAKACLFGSPVKPSRLGEIAGECLKEAERHFPDVLIDKWVVMPNHIHVIVILSGNHVQLSTVIGQYKSAVTKKIHAIQPHLNVWQFSFHDHVIRSQTDYQRIWSYIDTNPARWMDDCFYIPMPDL